MNRPRNSAWALLLAAPLVQTLSAQAFPVKSHTLKNGMKVLVQEDHGIPNVAFYTFYRIGSATSGPAPRGFRTSSNT